MAKHSLFKFTVKDVNGNLVSETTEKVEILKTCKHPDIKNQFLLVHIDWYNKKRRTYQPLSITTPKKFVSEFTGIQSRMSRGLIS